MAKSPFASGFAGFLLGIVTGLGIAAGAAVFITNSPIPFVEKIQKVTADVDPAQKLAGGIDPNRALNAQQEQSQSASESTVKTVVIEEPTPIKAKPSQADVFWLQVGAFKSSDAAEEQKAILAWNALENVRIEKAGNLWKVRVGPFKTRQEANEIQAQLNDQGIKASVTR